MGKENQSKEENVAETHVHLAKALESLDRIHPKTEQIKHQMSIIALIGLGFELGLERVIHKSLGDVAKAMHNLKHFFMGNTPDILSEAMSMAKKKDDRILSKFLYIQDQPGGKERLMEFLKLKIDTEKLTPEELCHELLHYLNRYQVNLDNQQN